MAQFGPFGRKYHLKGKTAAQLAFFQRAFAGGQRFREHARNAVRKIGRVGTPIGFFVQNAVERHVGRNVGNRDDNLPATLILRVVISLRKDGVVMVTRIRGVDGDERDLREVIARAFHRLGRFCSCNNIRIKCVRNVVRRHSDQAGSFWIVCVSEDFDDLAAFRTMAMIAGGLWLHAHKVAMARIHLVAWKDEERAFVLAGCAFDLTAAMRHLLKDADHRVRARFDLFDHARTPEPVAAFFNVAKGAISHARVRNTAFAAMARIDDLGTEQAILTDSFAVVQS